MIAVIAIPFGCGLIFIVLYVVFMQIAIVQLPSWAQPAANAWMQGIPQNSDYVPGAVNGTGVGNSGPVVAGATNVPWGDYSDPATSNIGGTPVHNRPKPLVNCIFGKQAGYGMTASGFHPGVDWPVPTGTPVNAIMGGEVVFAGFDASPLMVENPPFSDNAPAAWAGRTVSQWGGLVVVQNGDFQIWYAHMEQINVSVGQVVNSGDVVGLADSLGNSTGPHVHLGVKMKSGNSYVWVDPMNLQIYGFSGITPDMYQKIECK